jgi:hypothetical protein
VGATWAESAENTSAASISGSIEVGERRPDTTATTIHAGRPRKFVRGGCVIPAESVGRDDHVQPSSSPRVTVGHRHLGPAATRLRPFFVSLSETITRWDAASDAGFAPIFAASVCPQLLKFKRVHAHGTPEPILNLGMRFSNKCGVQLNVRRMERFIAMIIIAAKPG